MTMHTRAATDEIYEIFNQPVKAVAEEHEDSADEDDYETDGDYTSGAESTYTTTRNIATSEAGDDIGEREGEGEETSDVKSVSEWSDFSTRKHIPRMGGEDEQKYTQSSALVDPADDEHSGPISQHADQEEEEEEEYDLPAQSATPKSSLGVRTSFIPMPPEDYEPPTRPYRDPVEVANNRLPFMTPIPERTETSLSFTSENSDDPRFDAKTPSRRDGVDCIPEESFSDLEALGQTLGRLSMMLPPG